MEENIDLNVQIDHMIEAAEADPKLYDRMIESMKSDLDNEDHIEAIKLANPGEDMAAQITGLIEKTAAMRSLVLPLVKAKANGDTSKVASLRTELKALLELE